MNDDNKEIKFVKKIIKNIQKDGWQLIIEFEKSRSKYYSDAVEIAQTLPQYKYREIDNKPLHQLKFTIEEINDITVVNKLLELMDYIKNCSLKLKIKIGYVL